MGQIRLGRFLENAESVGCAIPSLDRLLNNCNVNLILSICFKILGSGLMIALLFAAVVVFSLKVFPPVRVLSCWIE